MKSYLLNRLGEPSTWRGIVMLATACGLQVAPEMANAVVSVGVGIVGLIGVLAKGK